MPASVSPASSTAASPAPASRSPASSELLETPPSNTADEDGKAEDDVGTRLDESGAALDEDILELDESTALDDPRLLDEDAINEVDDPSRPEVAAHGHDPEVEGQSDPSSSRFSGTQARSAEHKHPTTAVHVRMSIPSTPAVGAEPMRDASMCLGNPRIGLRSSMTGCDMAEGKRILARSWTMSGTSAP